MDASTHIFRFELANIGAAGLGRNWFLITTLCDGEPHPDFPQRTACLSDAEVLALSRKVCEMFRHLKLRIGIVREID